MTHWTDRENWVNKKPRNHQKNIDKYGTHLTYEEMDALQERAHKLSLGELEELTHEIGVVLGRFPDGDYLNEESYLGALHEANDFRKLYRYLDEHNV